MELLTQILLMTLAGMMCGMCMARGLPVEELSITDILRKVSKSSKSFNFAWDEKNHLALTEYDIVVPQEEWLMTHYPHRQKRTVGVIDNHNKHKRWPGKVVYYEIARGEFNDEDIKIMYDSFTDWETYTCVKFKEEKFKTNRVVFVNATDCWSSVGMFGDKPQELGLAPGCRWRDLITHELGHALGLRHEQTRPDRDEYVTIHYENIPEGMEKNFALHSWDDILKTGIPYDYESLMHYPKDAFSPNGEITIETKDPKYQDIIGTARELSFRDIKTMNIMYKCNEKCSKKDSECPGEGFVGKDCECWCSSKNAPAQHCSGSAICGDSTGACRSHAQDGLCFLSVIKETCRGSCNMC